MDGAARGDIGVVRSLGFGGVPIHLLVSNPRSPTAASGYVTATHRFPEKAAPDEEKIERIREVASTMRERPIIMATGDTGLRLISTNREKLDDLVDHDLAPAEVLASCLDKDLFAAAAERLQLPTPKTYVPSDFGDLETRAASLQYPVFMKPIIREDWARMPKGIIAPTGFKGLRVDSRDELVGLYQSLSNNGGGRVVVQEMVQGDDSEHMSVHAYVTPNGHMLGIFTAKKQRIWPPHAGVGAMVTSHPFPEPERLARDALRKLEYTGFAILQFKRDARRDSFELLEINCRYSTWTELPSRAGCNFPLAAYATISGQAPPVLKEKYGMSWLDFERDVDSMRDYWRSGEWSWLAYLRSLATVRCWAFLAMDDPKPFVRKVLNRR